MPCQGRSRRRRWPKASLYKALPVRNPDAIGSIPIDSAHSQHGQRMAWQFHLKRRRARTEDGLFSLEHVASGAVLLQSERSVGEFHLRAFADRAVNEIIR